MEPVKFISKYKRLKLVLDPGGKRAIPTKDGGIEVVTFPRKIIEFKNFEYSTNKKSELDALRNNKYFGKDFWEEKPIDLASLIEEKKREINLLSRKLASQKRVEIACDVEGCEYVASGETREKALKSLNAHKLKKHGIAPPKVKKEENEENEVSDEK